ncbi:hypothetical protein MAUB1S_08473 [Mycolicibacterium aubagnense]
MNSLQSNLRFEAVVARLFEALNFSVRRAATYERIGKNGLHHLSEVDLLLTLSGVRTVVEVKMYRSRTPRISDMERAAFQALNAREAMAADHAALVVNLRRDRLPDQGLLPAGVVLIGLDDLIAMAAGNTDILSELADITQELQSGLADFDTEVDMSPARAPVTVTAFMGPGDGMRSSAPLPDKGAKLAIDLLAITPGQRTTETLPSGRTGVNWSLFEEVGQKCLEYIFEHELTNWHAQSSVGGDANRLDVMAKVSGDDVFSRTLIEDFRSRYVLFEFKNYADPIGANMVHITEKYLFPTALRSTVVFVSPRGLSPQACEATRGALRDARKLMLDLPVKLLVSMLHEKDRGNAGGARMEALLDTFLLSLGR